MQKFLFGLALVMLFPFLSQAQVNQWEEGTHYEIIADEVTAKPEVKEFFSFWCPACYRFEPIVAQIKDKLPEDIKLDKVHVNFMGMAGRDVQDTATKAMMIARALKKEDQLNGAIFNYIHQQRAIITGLEDLRKIFIVNGVDGEEFDKLAKSFSVNSLVARNNNKIDEYREHVTGVPNFIINGKYQAVFTKDRSLSADDMVNLVIWLTEQK